MSHWFFLMESLSELDGGLAGRLGATLHTTGPWGLGQGTPPPEEMIWLRGRSDLKGVVSRWLEVVVERVRELISMGKPSWWSFIMLLVRLGWK